MGCGLCKVYCKTEHSKSKNIVRAFNVEVNALPRIKVEVKGFTSYAIQCRQCNEPICVFSCLTGAMTLDAAKETVKYAASKCIGCWSCVMSCPYGALGMDMVEHTVAKCDLCPDRDVPACVANCPNEALSVNMEIASK